MEVPARFQERREAWWRWGRRTGESLAHAGALCLPGRWRGGEAGVWQPWTSPATPGARGCALPGGARAAPADGLPRPADAPWIFGFPSERHFRLGQRVFGYRPLAGVEELGGDIPEGSAIRRAAADIETSDPAVPGPRRSGRPAAPRRPPVRGVPQLARITPVPGATTASTGSPPAPPKGSPFSPSWGRRRGRRSCGSLRGGSGTLRCSPWPRTSGRPGSGRWRFWPPPAASGWRAPDIPRAPAHGRAEVHRVPRPGGRGGPGGGGCRLPLRHGRYDLV